MAWVTSELEYYARVFLCFRFIPQQLYQGKLDNFVFAILSMMVETPFVIFCKSVYPSAELLPNKTRRGKNFSLHQEQLLKVLSGCEEFRDGEWSKSTCCDSGGAAKAEAAKTERENLNIVTISVLILLFVSPKCSSIVVKPYPESFCGSERAEISRDKGQGKHPALWAASADSYSLPHRLLITRC